MSDFIQVSTTFGVVLSLLAYMIGLFLQKKTKKGIFNPLLISIILVILILRIFRLEYSDYQSSAKYLSYLLTPATVCLAISLYRQFVLLKQNYTAILGGILAGVITSMLSVFVLAFFFKLSYEQYITLLPKSITTAIAMGVVDEMGGYTTIAIVVIIITGVVGNVFAEGICKMFHITNPIARGVAIGTSSHAIGTARAMEMGKIEGAMSSLSIVVSGIITVILVPVFAKFI